MADHPSGHTTIITGAGLWILCPENEWVGFDARYWQSNREQALYGKLTRHVKRINMWGMLLR